MIIMKFGGSSVGSADAMRQVAGIVAQYRDRQSVVVVSAMKGVTDRLLNTIRAKMDDRDSESEIWGNLTPNIIKKPANKAGIVIFTNRFGS